MNKYKKLLDYIKTLQNEYTDNSACIFSFVGDYNCSAENLETIVSALKITSKSENGV